MSFSGRTDGPMEAAQRDFLHAQRAGTPDQKGDFRLLEVSSDAEQRLLAAFFDGWVANTKFIKDGRASPIASSTKSADRSVCTEHPRCPCSWRETFRPP